MDENFKERTLRLEIFADDLKQPQDIDLNRIMLEGNRLKFHSKDGKEIKQFSQYKIGFEGKKNFKSDVRIHQEGTSLEMEPLYFLLDFNELYFMDTNSKDGFSVSVILQKLVDKAESRFFYRKKQNPRYMRFPTDEAPEKRAIFELIQTILNRKDTMPEGYRIAIINDSALGEMDDINKQKKPLYKDFYLPKAFQLIYASSDRGRTALNLIFKFCDRRANKMRDRILEEGFPVKDMLIVRQSDGLTYWFDPNVTLVMPQVEI